jgi:hypothetical protein
MPKRTSKPRPRPDVGLSDEPPPELEIGVQAMIEASLQDFERFVMSTNMGPGKKLQPRMQKLLKNDPDIFRAIFASGLMAGVETMTATIREAADLYEAQHQASHQGGRPVGRA